MRGTAAANLLPRATSISLAPGNPRAGTATATRDQPWRAHSLRVAHGRATQMTLYPNLLAQNDHRRTSLSTNVKSTNSKNFRRRGKWDKRGRASFRTVSGYGATRRSSVRPNPQMHEKFHQTSLDMLAWRTAVPRADWHGPPAMLNADRHRQTGLSVTAVVPPRTHRCASTKLERLRRRARTRVYGARRACLLPAAAGSKTARPESP
jgi:hypothetical protein